MSARAIVVASSVPRLADHRRLRFDKARDCWTIQAPERAFVLDEIAHAIVSQCDGKNTIDDAVDALCRMAQDAPRDVIARDVTALIQNFVDKGVMAL